ncbi:MAG: efflux RND transporter periplasmic adaptor subunit [bacterium]
MKKRIITLTIIILIVSIISFILIKKNVEKTVTITKGSVTRGELILKVTSRGKIEAKERFELRAKIPGVVVDILEEGTEVKKGQIIATMNDKELLAKQKEQSALLVSYQSELNSLLRGINLKEIEEKADEAKVWFDEINRQFLSKKRLFEINAVSEDEYKRLEVECEKAKIALNLANYRLEEKRNQYQEEIETVTSKIASVKANLTFIQQQVDWSKIPSPIDGIVIYKGSKEGTYVPQGQLLSVVISPSQFVVKTDLDEVDIAKIGLGMKTTVIPDAFPGQSISGVITKIAPSPILQEKINTFEVTITLVKSSLPLRSEMLTDVVIISKRKVDVLKIPYEATLSIDDKFYVFVLKDNKLIKQEVSLGLRNPNEVEVLSGLKIGEEVVLNPPVDLKEGTKIKVRKNAD